MNEVTVGFVYQNKAYMAEMSEVMGAGTDYYALRVFRNGKSGFSWYSAGSLFRGQNNEWVFATPKGRFPEIAAQLEKYIKKK